MSKPRDIWWGYVKAMIRVYPLKREGALAERENAAVSRALEETSTLPGGADRRRLIDLVFFAQTHTLEGAAQQLHCSVRTARRWHTDFIRLVAKKYGLLP